MGTFISVKWPLNLHIRVLWQWLGIIMGTRLITGLVCRTAATQQLRIMAMALRLLNTPIMAM